MERVAACLNLFGEALKICGLKDSIFNNKEKPNREEISKCEERQVVIIVFEKIYDWRWCDILEYFTRYPWSAWHNASRMIFWFYFYFILWIDRRYMCIFSSWKGINIYLVLSIWYMYLIYWKLNFIWNNCSNLFCTAYHKLAP